MKGITPIVAIILLLLITISLAGVAFLWFTRMGETASQAGSSQLNKTTGLMMIRIRIDNIEPSPLRGEGGVGGGGPLLPESQPGNAITIRNMGSRDISSSEMGFYVDNEIKGCDGDSNPGNGVTSFNIAPSEIRTCYLCNEASGSSCTALNCNKGSRIKIISSSNTDEETCP